MFGEQEIDEELTGLGVNARLIFKGVKQIGNAQDIAWSDIPEVHTRGDQPVFAAHFILESRTRPVAAGAWGPGISADVLSLDGRHWVTYFSPGVRQTAYVEGAQWHLEVGDFTMAPHDAELRLQIRHITDSDVEGVLSLDLRDGGCTWTRSVPKSIQKQDAPD